VQTTRPRKGNNPVAARNSNSTMDTSTTTTCESIKSTVDGALTRKREHEAIQTKPNRTYTDGLRAGKGSNGNTREKDYKEEKNIAK
jgi:hypothetical protein